MTIALGNVCDAGLVKIVTKLSVIEMRTYRIVLHPSFALLPPSQTEGFQKHNRPHQEQCQPETEYIEYGRQASARRE